MKRSKTIITHFTALFFICSLLIFSACSKSEEEEENPQDEFVGTWTLIQYNYNFTADGKPLNQYLLDLDFSADEVSLETKNLVEMISAQFAGGAGGGFELKADNTFVAKFGTEEDTGTWSYDASSETLTINSNGGILQGFSVVGTTTQYRMSLAVIETTVIDLGDDGTDDEVEINIRHTYSK